jgi:hypothetical protein
MSTIQKKKDALFSATIQNDPEAIFAEGHPLPNWESGGTERLTFEHPNHRRILGTVEIDTTTDLQQVRLELVVPPELAEKVIRMCLAEPAEIYEPKPAHVAEEITVPFVPPTKDPTPDDLADMAAEEAESDLPLPVDTVIHLEHC